MPSRCAKPGTPDERFGHWQTLVHRGEVIPAYRIFRGLYEEPENRERALSELCFAGLIDVQDRMLNNRSYTTGHKAYRARATVELVRLVGYENSHPIIYAGALDIAVGPRWYSTYELACNAVKIFIEGQTLSAVPYGGTAEEERALYANTDAPSAEEAERLITAILREPEPGYLEVLADLLKAGKSLVHLIDTIQVGAARLVLETGAPMNFSMAQHCYEYCNTLRWFYDTFEHPQRVKLLFLAASFLNRAAHHQAHIPGNGPVEIQAPAEAAGMDAEAILDRIEDAVIGLDPEGSRNWTQAYLDSGRRQGRAGRAPGTRRLEDRQRPAQPGTGPDHAGGLSLLHLAEPRHLPPRQRPPRRRPPQIRQPPLVLGTLRRGIRIGAVATRFGHLWIVMGIFGCIYGYVLSRPFDLHPAGTRHPDR